MSHKNDALRDALAKVLTGPTSGYKADFLAKQITRDAQNAMDAAQVLYPAVAAIMDKGQEYNGWSNRETWAVNLWISNERGSYEQVKALADEHHESRADLADAIKDWIEGNQPELGPTLWSDLMGTALGEVDWYGIAESWIEDWKDRQA